MLRRHSQADGLDYGYGRLFRANPCPADAEDDLFPASETDALYRAAGEPKELWTVQGAGHSRAMAADPEEFARKITQFFRKNL